MKEIINKVVDDGNFFELQTNFAKNIIVGISHIIII
jgi:propionyl-CoA carboxylase beta chain